MSLELNKRGKAPRLKLVDKDDLWIDRLSMQSLVSAIPHLHNPADINQIHADIRSLVSNAGIRNDRMFSAKIYPEL